MDVDTGHALFTRTIATFNGGSENTSSLAAGRSVHKLPGTVSFRQLNTAHETTKQSGYAVDYLGGVGPDLYFTAQRSPPVSNGKTKRAREEEHEERVDTFLKPLKDKLSPDDLERARCLLVRLARDLKGSKHEPVLQNYGVSIRKLAASDAEPRVVIFARLHSGVAIGLSKLKGVLGDCWADGCVTTAEAASGVELGDLPYSEEAAAGIELGNRPLLVVTSLPVVVVPKKEG
jgi:hypothetical protein